MAQSRHLTALTNVRFMGNNGHDAMSWKLPDGHAIAGWGFKTSIVMLPVVMLKARATSRISFAMGSLLSQRPCRRYNYVGRACGYVGRAFGHSILNK
jgi:hypothetical protein